MQRRQQQQAQGLVPLLVVLLLALCATTVRAFFTTPAPRTAGPVIRSQLPPATSTPRIPAAARTAAAPRVRDGVVLAGASSDEESGTRGGLDGLLIKLGYKSEDGEDATRSLKEKLKSAGISGVLAYVSSEVLFWFISLPLGILFYHQTTGEWLDLGTAEGKAKVAGFSAGFLAFARVALPVRAAVALAITPALDKYVVRPLVERGVLKEKEEE